ncbi:MAG: hypothetical protein IPP91_15035 [Betaproteobacteria bacterium]|nr:hypothetical protein [Betaproteobacteria bacterium]
MRRMALVLFMLLAGTALGAPVRLDDSASPKARVEVKPRWQFEQGDLDNPERLNAMVAEVAGLEVRLNTSRFVSRTGRIYLVVPVSVPGLRGATGMRIEWRARGPLMAGSALPGTRSLVYDGVIAQPMIADVLDLKVYLDARYVDRGLRFEPYFEIELAP